MKLLCTVGALVSILWIAAGLFQLWRLGVHGGGVFSLFAAFVCAFSVSVTLYLFHLRARITSLEKQLKTLP